MNTCVAYSGVCFRSTQIVLLSITLQMFAILPYQYYCVHTRPAQLEKWLKQLKEEYAVDLVKPTGKSATPGGANVRSHSQFSNKVRQPWWLRT